MTGKIDTNVFAKEAAYEAFLLKQPSISHSEQQWLQAYYEKHKDCTPEPLDLTPSKLVRPSWDDYFFQIAKDVSTRATCPRAQVGVVLVDSRHRIVSTGFNGAPAGEPHCTDVGCWLYADHCVMAVHAERNAVDTAFEMISTLMTTDLRKDRGFLSALDIQPYIYAPLDSCSDCARVMARAGIKKEPKTRRV